MLKLTAYSMTDLQKIKNVMMQMDAKGLSAQEALLQIEQAMGQERIHIKATERHLRRADRQRWKSMAARQCPDCGKPMMLTMAEESQPDLAVLVCKTCGRSVFEGKTFSEYVGG